MRVFPRFRIPNFKLLARRLARLSRCLPITRVAVTVEWLIFSGILLFALMAGRGAFADDFGPGADLTALIPALLACALVHTVLRRYLMPCIERYFSPVGYDKRRILFDLVEEARRAIDTDHLFRLIVEQISERLQAEDASIFLCDEATGNYVCRFSSSQAMAQQTGHHPAGDGTPIESPLMLARDAFVVSRLRSLTSPLEIGPKDFEAWEHFLAAASPAKRAARHDEQQTLAQIKTCLLIPVFSKDQLVGLISLGPCRIRHRYDVTDKEMLVSIGSQLALVVENSRLSKRMLADERLRRDLEIATEVQRRLLPAHPPETVSVDLVGYCQPARGVGGDYYDFIALDQRRIGIAIADVSGKGVGAALLMSMMQATLRGLLSCQTTHWQADDSLAKMVTRLNRLMHNSTAGVNYATFFYANFDEITRQLTYVNAGHNPPILFGSGAADDCRELCSGGQVLGISDDCPYEQELVQMRPGDLLFAFTDGLSDVFNAKGEVFSEARIRETLAACARNTVDDIRDEIVRRVQTWGAGVPQYDDLTFLVMKVK